MSTAVLWEYLNEGMNVKGYKLQTHKKLGTPTVLQEYLNEGMDGHGYNLQTHKKLGTPDCTVGVS